MQLRARVHRRHFSDSSIHPVSVTKTKRHPKKNPSWQANKKVFPGSPGRSRRCAPSAAPSATDPRPPAPDPLPSAAAPGLRQDGPPAGARAGRREVRPGGSAVATAQPGADARPGAAPPGPGGRRAAGSHRAAPRRGGAGGTGRAGRPRFAPALAAPLAPRTARGHDGTSAR